MHKYLTKTTNFGKKIVFLPKCHSTNDIASEMLHQNQLKDGDIVMTSHQTKGRGQRGNIWISEKNMNLTCTVVASPDSFYPEQNFLLTMIISLAIIRMVKPLVPEVCIKWPNDILVGRNKLTGILIETTIKNGLVKHALMGIGFNINQLHFTGINATSLRKLTGNIYGIDEVLEQIMLELENLYPINYEKLPDHMDEYHRNLMWMNELHEFFDGKNHFNGIIKGINHEGLLVLDINGKLKTFDVKELSYIK